MMASKNRQKIYVLKEYSRLLSIWKQLQRYRMQYAKQMHFNSYSSNIFTRHTKPRQPLFQPGYIVQIPWSHTKLPTQDDLNQLRKSMHFRRSFFPTGFCSRKIVA